MAAGDAMASAGAPPDTGDDTGAGGDQDQDPQGFTIEIKVPASGPMSVSVEQGGDDDEGEGDQDSGQQVKSLNDLVSLIKDIVRNGGSMQDAGDDDFNAGAGIQTPGAGQ